MASFLAALERVKADHVDLLSDELIEGVCRSEGHTWRDRALGPAATVRLLLTQALQSNVPAAALSRISGLAFSDSAFSQARARLPVEALRTLLRWIASEAAPARLEGAWRWRGHRVTLIDGSAFSMPDTPELQDRFGQPAGQKPGCGFPVAHTLAVFDAATGMILDLALWPLDTHDAAAASRSHGCLGPGDVLIMDRAFCSYAHLATLTGRGILSLARLHQRMIVDFAPGRDHTANRGKRIVKGRPRSRFVRELGRQDQLVEWVKPRERPAWMSAADFAALPESLRVRELRFEVAAPGFRTRAITLVTTLTDADKYPKAELAELFRGRWRVETDLRHLKQTLKMDVLRPQSADAVEKTALAFAIAYNLVCLVMMAAAKRRGVRPDRVSFTDALRWLLWGGRPDTLAGLILCRDRPGRVHPRAVKRRPKECDRMTRPRGELIQRLIDSRPAA